jgi:hypothetical protein
MIRTVAIGSLKILIAGVCLVGLFACQLFHALGAPSSLTFQVVDAETGLALQGVIADVSKLTLGMVSRTIETNYAIGPTAAAGVLNDRLDGQFKANGFVFHKSGYYPTLVNYHIGNQFVSIGHADKNMPLRTAKVNQINLTEPILVLMYRERQ